MTKSSNHRKSAAEYDSLYICMKDADMKRKNLLLGIKDSLVMQEEYRKIADFRIEKNLLLKEIKKDMESIKSEYDKLRKLLPNVKNILPATEKELMELDEQITMLRHDIEADKEGIEMRKEIKTTTKVPKLDVEVSEKPSQKYKTIATKLEKTKESEKSHEKENPRLDRIKNNLSIIENKLKNL